PCPRAGSTPPVCRTGSSATGRTPFSSWARACTASRTGGALRNGWSKRGADTGVDDRSKVLKFRSYGWDGVPVREYKTGDVPYRGVTRQTLLGEGTGE